MRGATWWVYRRPPEGKISIHAPREGSDADALVAIGALIGFQSTLPVRGATGVIKGDGDALNLFQSTLPVRGATVFFRGLSVSVVFQSTLPVRGATGVIIWILIL